MADCSVVAPKMLKLLAKTRPRDHHKPVRRRRKVVRIWHQLACQKRRNMRSVKSAANAALFVDEISISHALAFLFVYGKIRLCQNNVFNRRIDT